MLPPSGSFDVTRHDPAGNASAVYNAAAVRGFALGAHPTDHLQFVPATSTNFIGHLTRDVIAGGLTMEERVFGRTSATPVPIESPFIVGDQVTVQRAVEIEAEGSLLLLSGTGAIGLTTAIGSKLSFNAGRISVAQTGEQVYYTLSANALAASDENAATVRIRAVKV